MSARPRAVCGVQARMGSRRLPGKSLADLAGAPLVRRVVDRARAARRVDLVVVLTSVAPADDALAAYCEGAGIPCRRGPEDDVLARYLALADELEPELVVRVTGDCPLVAPELVDLQLEALAALDGDFCALPPGFGGAACEGQGALSARALRDAARSGDPRDREHVGSFWHAERAASYRTVELRPPAWLDRDDVRLCVDEPADLELARAVFARFAPEHGSLVPLREVLRFLDQRPELRRSNLAVPNAAATAAAHRARAGATRAIVGRWSTESHSGVSPCDKPEPHTG